MKYTSVIIQFLFPQSDVLLNFRGLDCKQAQRAQDQAQANTHTHLVACSLSAVVTHPSPYQLTGISLRASQHCWAIVATT